MSLPPCEPVLLHPVNSPDVSIIIRCKNEASLIGVCLRRIFEQKTRWSFEVVVIDSGSTDGTVAIATSFPVSIYSIRPEDFNFGSSLNLGVSLSRGHYCVSLSAHVVPYDNQWLETLVSSVAEREQVAGAYSRQLYWEDTCLIERRQLAEKFGPVKRYQTLEGYLDKFDVRPRGFIALRPFIFFSNACSCVRKAVVEQYPFKELTGSEDREWAMNVLQCGYTIVYEPASRAYHAHNEILRAWYKRIFINAKAVKTFTGYKPGLWIIPLLVANNLVRDALYLVREAGKARKGMLRAIVALLKELPTSTAYWVAHAIAYYKGARA